MSEVQIRGLTKRFGKVVAVDDVTLTLSDGEFFGLLGPSGSGKTTLMRCVAGFIDQDAGEIAIDGINLRGVPTSRRDIGMVFQNYALFPHMTVAQNIAFSLRVRGTAATITRERVNELLAMVQLQGFDGRLPKELSGGQQQRVALARAVASNPRVLLLDEPLNALDRRLRQIMQIELKQIQRDIGITTIFVTHDQDEALALCDRIAIFKDGKIEQMGKPVEVYEKPRTEFSAAFLGAANFLRGRSVSSEHGSGTIALDSGETIQTMETVAPGQKVTLVVRPEKLSIRASGVRALATDALLNCLSGTVERLVYLGSNTTYVIRHSSGELTVNQQNIAEEPLPPGTQVVLSWRPEHSVLLAA
jgi:spermidine/putrescine ABC transporter ATP-binding subunit